VLLPTNQAILPLNNLLLFIFSQLAESDQTETDVQSFTRTSFKVREAQTVVFLLSTNKLQDQTSPDMTQSKDCSLVAF